MCVASVSVHSIDGDLRLWAFFVVFLASVHQFGALSSCAEPNLLPSVGDALKSMGS